MKVIEPKKAQRQAYTRYEMNGDPIVSLEGHIYQRYLVAINWS